MELKPAFKNKQSWKRMRQALYHELDDDFQKDEMALIANDSEKRESFIVFDRGHEIGLLEMSLRNFVDGCLTSPVAYIEGIFINKTYTGQGYGRKILNEAKAWGMARGCTEIASDSELDNLDAQKFHIAMGFQVTYRIVQYKMKI